MSDVQLRIGQLQFGSVTGSSGVFVGQSVQKGWRATNKGNQGFGKTTGCHNHTQIASRVDDGDFIDTLRPPRDLPNTTNQ
ncbi:MAG: hypothetical protein OWT28_07375 [Firmicutes bacterium]|nr:hypothetical protein [Bacillota bacterium]